MRWFFLSIANIENLLPGISPNGDKNLPIKRINKKITTKELSKMGMIHIHYLWDNARNHNVDILFYHSTKSISCSPSDESTHEIRRWHFSPNRWIKSHSINENKSGFWPSFKNKIWFFGPTLKDCILWTTVQIIHRSSYIYVRIVLLQATPLYESSKL